MEGGRAGWILGHWWVLLCGFFATLCCPLRPDELELPRFQVTFTVPHKTHSPCQRCTGLVQFLTDLTLLGEPVATSVLLRNKSWQLLFAQVWLFTANFLQFSNSCSPYSRTLVMYCLYFLLDSSPDCFLFSCYQFCTLPDLVRVLIFLDTFFEVIDSYPVIIYFSSSSLFLISTRSLSRFFLENRTLVSMLSSHKFAFRPMKHDKPLFNYLFWTGAMRMS